MECDQENSREREMFSLYLSIQKYVNKNKNEKRERVKKKKKETKRVNSMVRFFCTVSNNAS